MGRRRHARALEAVAVADRGRGCASSSPRGGGRTRWTRWRRLRRSIRGSSIRSRRWWRSASRVAGCRCRPSLSADELRAAKRLRSVGCADSAHLTARPRRGPAPREALGVAPVFKTVDTCAGEFAARTPYHYSTYEAETEVRPAERPRVVILGAGPNRIGQGIEFDYACVHAAFALEEAGFESVMVNSQPRDRLDRLRHVEPAVLRAADGRGRAWPSAARSGRWA